MHKVSKLASKFARWVARGERRAEATCMRAAASACLRGDTRECAAFMSAASRAKESAEKWQQRAERWSR